jgi:hypothetical protein
MGTRLPPATTAPSSQPPVRAFLSQPQGQTLGSSDCSAKGHAANPPPSDVSAGSGHASPIPLCGHQAGGVRSGCSRVTASIIARVGCRSGSRAGFTLTALPTRPLLKPRLMSAIVSQGDATDALWCFSFHVLAPTSPHVHHPRLLTHKAPSPDPIAPWPR